MSTLTTAATARPIDEIEYYRLPERTADGVRCGSCSDTERGYGVTGPDAIVRHATVAHVRHCWAIQQEWEAEHRAEIAAERAAERYFEEGPGGGYYAGSEEEARDRFNDWLAGR